MARFDWIYTEESRPIICFMLANKTLCKWEHILAHIEFFFYLFIYFFFSAVPLLPVEHQTTWLDMIRMAKRSNEQQGSDLDIRDQSR